MKGQAEMGGEEKAPPIPLKKKTGESSLFLLQFHSFPVSSTSYPLASLNVLPLTPSLFLTLPSSPLSLHAVMLYKEIVKGYHFDDTIMQPLYIPMAETGPPALPPKKRKSRRQVCVQRMRGREGGREREVMCVCEWVMYAATEAALAPAGRPCVYRTVLTESSFTFARVVNSSQLVSMCVCVCVCVFRWRHWAG